MGHQAAVKETYLRVIEATLAGSKAELEADGDSNDALEVTLDKLRERWTTRLLESLDFTEDPTATVRGSTGRGGGGKRPNAAAAAAAGALAAADSAVLASPDLDGAPSLEGAASPDAPLTLDTAAASSLATASMPAPGVSFSFQTDSSVGVDSVAGAQRDSGQPLVPIAGPVGAVPSRFTAPTLYMPDMPGTMGFQPMGSVPRRAAGVSGALPAASLASLDRVTFPAPSCPGVDPGPGASSGSANVPQGDGDGYIDTATATGTRTRTAAATPAATSAAGDDLNGDGSGAGTPPTKRVRQEKVNSNEDLGSEDSDDEQSEGGSDGDFENYILAQHDTVKKGAKWKVRLKDGILHLNGRDYLFSKASCDLDW
jgi:Transcription factor IIA, alpha/beta subunit